MTISVGFLLKTRATFIHLGILCAYHCGNLGGSSDVLGIPSTVYVTRSVVHAERPLTVPVVTPSAVTCALLCRRSEGCLKWSRRPEERLCHLWPAHSADNPLTAAAEAVHQYIIPPEYTLSPSDRRVAYRGHATPTPGGYNLLAKCREDDPGSTPAFPASDEELSTLISLPFNELWTGINDIEEEGVFNPATGREFRDKILAQGGSREPMELFVDFRGREPSVEPLLRHSGIAA